MGKGKRNGRKPYRIVVHSAAYMKKKRILDARKKAIRNGEIFTGAEIKVMPMILPHAVVDLFNEINKNKRIVQGEEIFHGKEVVPK